MFFIFGIITVCCGIILAKIFTYQCVLTQFLRDYVTERRRKLYISNLVISLEMGERVLTNFVSDVREEYDFVLI
jgi:hypothetical protein